MLKTAE